MRFGQGKVVAIMGGSGMGKTTLLKLIGGLLTPQSGTVTIAGETLRPGDDKALYRVRRRMGMLFQFGALFPSSTMWLSRCASRRTWMKKRFAIWC